MKDTTVAITALEEKLKGNKSMIASYKSREDMARSDLNNTLERQAELNKENAELEKWIEFMKDPANAPKGDE